jgi:type IV pilus assembly protein PilC
MAKFSYKVRDREDRVVLGTMDAFSADEVVGKLTLKNLLPIQVKEVDENEARPTKTLRDRLDESMKGSRNRVPYKSVVFFTRQLATMVGQGVPLSKSLEQLTKGEKPAFKKIIQQVADDIATGLTLSDAIARHRGAFNPMYIAIVRSGEEAGALDRVLEGMANYLESAEIMRGKVKTAMRYPIFIAGFVSIMMFGIMWKLVPTFETIYLGMHAQLPLPTQILISTSHFIRGNTVLCLGLVTGIFILYKYLMTMEQFRIVFAKNILHVPVLGGILQKNIWATYSRTMALLMEAGTPILKANEIAGAAVDNPYFTRELDKVYAGLRRGEMLSEALEASGIFSVLLVQLVSTGETSGRIDALLRKAAEFYEREIRNVVDSLSAIIEPVLIVVLGVVVGGILISLYMPIFMVGKFIK